MISEWTAVKLNSLSHDGGISAEAALPAIMTLIKQPDVNQGSDLLLAKTMRDRASVSRRGLRNSFRRRSPDALTGIIDCETADHNAINNSPEKTVLRSRTVCNSDTIAATIPHRYAGCRKARQLRRLLYRQRSQQSRIDQTKDRSISSNPEAIKGWR